jgi:hypothetical protein
MMCVTTRFRLKHFWMLVPMYLTYLRMRRDLKQAPGLIRYAFLLQNPVTCCTFSLWESEEAIITFSNVPNHIQGVRRAGRWCREIWSAYWRIDAISKHASQWQGSGQGQGHWPTLVPHPEYPWHLVPLHAQEEEVRQ